jgi:hypothetical protein
MKADERSRAAAALGRMGGKSRTPRKLRQLAQARKKPGYGWPLMGVVTWTFTYNGCFFLSKKRRMSQGSYLRALQDERLKEAGWAATVSMDARTAEILKPKSTANVTVLVEG